MIDAARSFAKGAVRTMIADATDSADLDLAARPKARKRPRTEAAAAASENHVHTVAAEVARPAHVQASSAPIGTAATFQFVSASVAAQRTGLPKHIIKTWAATGIIASLKPGSDASHRLIDLSDLLHFIEMKRESPDASARQQVENEQKMRDRRTLIWVRGGPPMAMDGIAAQGQGQGRMSEEEIKMHTDALQLQGQRMEKLLGIDPATRVYGLELSASNDLNRAGFQDIVINHILQRKLDCLVIGDRDHVCPDAVWPLFEWLCRQYDVEIKLAPLPAAPMAVAAASASSAPAGAVDV
ncbi:MAG: hypothetical protein P4L81_00430 [Candidatus Pacebacteria bacterium]|nr:hypothetical protein [Candidatus Paceibacterota bacterium]